MPRTNLTIAPLSPCPALLSELQFANPFDAGLKPGGTTQETTQEAGMTPEEAILLLLREDSSITQKKIASRVGLTPDGVKFHINKLKEKGIIRREGPTKKGRWVIIKQR
ncbi:MAG TPA: winged helix-turn-helix domain-containing protein [Syntrophales bacterium]|nr:winged helix-turn-helix domain-containing protein [Syntrophales bacterium]